MRVCLLTPELPPGQVGGIGTYVEALAAGLGRRGHAIDVVGCDLLPPGRRCESRTWGRVVSLRGGAGLVGGPLGRAADAGLRGLIGRSVPAVWRAIPYLRARAAAAAALAVRRFVRGYGRRYDVIEYPNWGGHAAFLPSGPAARVARVSSPSTETGVDDARVLVAMERRAVRRAGLVIAHSEAMNRKGQELYGYPAALSLVIPLGLADAVPVAPPPPAGRLRLVSVGRAEDRKGTDLLLAALAAVLPEVPEAEFRFVGPGLPGYLATRPDVRAAWDRLRAACPGRIEDLGRVSEAEKEREYAAAHWLVTPSRFESFGLVAVEAMRAGTPVVYAAAGGLAEVGALGPHNVPVHGPDAAALAAALRAVAAAGAGPALAARSETRAAFARHFSADVMAERTAEAYRRVARADARTGGTGWT